MGLFYIRVNVKALVTGSITKWSPNSTSWHDQDQHLSTVLHNSGYRLRDELILQTCKRVTDERLHASGFRHGMI
jgi:hypothetical protein